MNVRIHCAAPLASVLSLLLAFPLRADNGTWLGISGDWGGSGIWNSDILAEGVDFTANFTGINLVIIEIFAIQFAIFITKFLEKNLPRSSLRALRRAFKSSCSSRALRFK